MSVTTLVYKFFPAFNADEVLAKMRASPRFENGPYAGLTDAQIKAKWDREGAQSRTVGTALHASIEAFLGADMVNAPEPLVPKPVWDQFLSFYGGTLVVGGLEVYRTEWSIFSGGLCGQLDALFRVAGTDRFVLYDWKLSKEIKMNNPWARGLGPLAEHDACNFVQYSLQLNVYRYILEREYDFEGVDGVRRPFRGIECKLVVFSPSGGGWTGLDVPDMRREVIGMLDQIN